MAAWHCAWALLALLLSGCTGVSVDVRLQGDDARMLPRYDYDYEGHRFTLAQGSLDVSVSTGKNAGSVVASVRVGGDAYEVKWASFAGDAPYQSGGVTRGLMLHGSTGNGSAELPAFFAYAACYGKATARHNGEEEIDPTTTRPEFDARLLVARGHVRDPKTGIIYDATKRGAYDPATPNDAFVNATGAQAILQLRTATGALWYHFEFEDVRLEKY